MTRLYGRAKIGERLNDYVPHGHWNFTTMISSIRFDGETACMTVDCGTTREIFEIYLRKILCPTLREGDIVIMDNLSSHKGTKVQKILMDYGACVKYLPPYSPDLNPIELMWSKIKTYIRSLKPRTEEALIATIGDAFSTIAPSDAKNYFFSDGYTAFHS